MDQTKNKEIEIDFGKIFYKMRNKFIFIVIITIIAAILSGLYTHFIVKPVYSATVKMYVYSNTDRIASDSTITTNELTASQDLVNTYIYILESDTVLSAVIDDLNLNCSTNALRGAIVASQAKNTVAFEVSVSAHSPKTAAKIANSIAKIAPREIVRVVKAGGVEIIDYAKVPTKPSSPNLGKNVFIATAVAFLVSFMAFFVFEMFDTTVTSAKDLEGEFDIPILGTVPNLGENNTTSNYGKSSHKHSMSVGELEPPAPANNSDLALDLKPSSTILENLQSMRGENNNE